MVLQGTPVGPHAFSGSLCPPSLPISSRGVAVSSKDHRRAHTQNHSYPFHPSFPHRPQAPKMAACAPPIVCLPEPTVLFQSLLHHLSIEDFLPHLVVLGAAPGLSVWKSSFTTERDTGGFISQPVKTRSARLSISQPAFFFLSFLPAHCGSWYPSRSKQPVPAG